MHFSCLGFPDPGCLAGIHPLLFKFEYSTSRHNHKTLHSIAPLSLASANKELIYKKKFTRLALQLFLVKVFKLFSFQLQDPMGPVSLFIVTTSPCQDWVICAPAAFLGCGSRFSGSLSGIEPLFPVTR
jgi:hypothetical protein